jgi:hypothetical protein
MRHIYLVSACSCLLIVGCGGRTSEAAPHDVPQSPSAQETPKSPGDSSTSVREKKVKVVPVSVAGDRTGSKDSKKEEREPEGTGFALPQDQGGKLVGDLLRPREKSLVTRSVGPRALPAPEYLEKPSVPLPAFKGKPPQPGFKVPGKITRPRELREDAPLGGYHGEPRPPGAIRLSTEPLARWPSPDPELPVPLPILAQPHMDRAPLADPTVDASNAAALETAMPMRDAPAPFLRINLPDPFEHQQAIRLRTPPSEDPMPAVTITRPLP